MPSATISTVGFTAQFAPQIKRATATLSDGTVVMMVPDTNIAALVGDDVTGTPKIRFYRSDSSRTNWTLNFTYTPSPAASSSTRAFVGTMTVGSDDRIGLVWQGTDNGLYFQVFTTSGGSWVTSGSVQTIAAANAVTNRYRAIDADYSGVADPAVIVYESKASAGPSAWTRVYIRNTDGSTWRKAYEYDHATGTGGNINIYTGSEDVSISWNQTGIVANVGQLLIYYTRTGFFYDHGDIVTELQYNVSTGTDNSATVLGSWPKFNQDVAAGTRRGWIFKTTNGLWQLAMVLGATNPQFQVTRLTHNAGFGPPIVDKTTLNLIYRATDVNGVPVRITPAQTQIYYGVNVTNAIGVVYADNRVMFGYLTSNFSYSGSASYSLSGTVFRYNNASDFSATYIDTQMRPLDNGFTYGSQPIGVYGGGNNRNQAGDLKFNFMGLYGYTGNTADSSHTNKVRAIIDTFYDPPVNVAPTISVSNNRPTLQARVQNTALYPNIRGKVEWNLARNSGFSTDLRQIAEPDANYRYFGSTTSQTPPPFNISLTLSGVGAQLLYSGNWYMRSRVVSDLGQVSAWSATTQFAVSHPPSALTRGPNAGDILVFGVAGSVPFTWQMSDTEPLDVQSAYRVTVIRLDTGSSVADTGKVVSSVNSVNVTLSSTLLDIPMQWSVALWDADDVQGPFSNPVRFTVSQPPLVRVTAPTWSPPTSTAAPTVTWVPTLFGSRLQKAFRVTVFTANSFDVFGRTVSNGWGTSDEGDVWTFDGGANTDYAVGSGVGSHNLGAVNSPRRTLLAGAFLNTDQNVDVNASALAVGAGIRLGLIARYIDSSNYMFAVVQLETDNSMTVRILQRVAGTDTQLASTVIPSAVWNTANWWRLRFKVVGDNYYAVAWLNNQPGYWITTATGPAALSSGGQTGTYSQLNSSNTNTLPVTAKFDNYSRYDSNNPVQIATSNWIQSTATSYAFPTNIIFNNSYYIVKVELLDAAGMLGQDSVGIATVWTAPTDGALSVTTDDYGATVNWTNSGIDVTFVAWRVYRRYMKTALVDLDDENSRNTWVLIYETDVVQSNYSYKDYLIPNNKATDYVVVQVADRFGSIVESPISSFSTVTVVGNRYYFIPTVPVGTIAAYQAANVTDDSYTDEVESATLHVIGRGRQVQVGDDLGVSGTLTIQLRGASTRGDREFLQRLASSKNLGVWMKNPFGDVKCVKLGNVQVKPLSGTGSTEMSDLTIPYEEVISDVPVTRL